MADDDSPSTPTTPPMVRDFKSLPAIQTSFSFQDRPAQSQERARPPPTRPPQHREQPQAPGTRPPLSPASPDPMAAPAKAGGLLGFFNRSSRPAKPAKTKSESAAPPPVRDPPSRSEPVRPPRHPAFHGAPIRAPSRTAHLPDHLLPLSPVTPKAAARAADPAPPRSQAQAQARTPMPPKSPKTKTSKPLRPAVWEPPPLFQAYPQAIKHAVLDASVLPAETILRIQANKREMGAREDLMRGMLDLDAPAAGPPSKEERTKFKHRRKISGSVSKADWTKKIYVLVTMGYLLQYSGDGAFDRLPEKILQLDKDSAAFASDVIPGKHWVLQISHLADGGDRVSTDASRSRFARLAFRSASQRRLAGTLFLVLDSADDMDSWMSSVRREIELLGGRRQRGAGEAGQREASVDRQPECMPNQRFLVKREPAQFLDVRTPENSPPLESGVDSPPRHSPGDSVPESVGGSYKRSSVARGPTGTPSTVTTMSDEQGQLDLLRGGGSRLSYMSSGTWTLNTSRGTSPTCSPTKETFEGAQHAHHPDGRAPPATLRPRRSTSALAQRRESQQAAPRELLPPPTLYGPKSMLGSGGARSSSPGPRSARANVRYSVANAPPLPRLSNSPPIAGVLLEHAAMESGPAQRPRARSAARQEQHARARAAPSEGPTAAAVADTLGPSAAAGSMYSNLRHSRSLHALPTAGPPEPAHPPPMPPMASVGGPRKTLVRPASLQVGMRSPSPPRPRANSRPPRASSTYRAMPSAASASAAATHTATTPKQMRVQNRKSMPSLARVGPPRMPPPNMPLPQVPGGPGLALGSPPVGPLPPVPGAGLGIGGLRVEKVM
ncbi:MAG: hypothetical protein M1832_001977 [Thelocarpon impressellum]|nr:MAG: hypothetical protein M1832_001977 [Thelocarpon impressellum]